MLCSFSAGSSAPDLRPIVSPARSLCGETQLQRGGER